MEDLVNYCLKNDEGVEESMNIKNLYFSLQQTPGVGTEKNK
jgi:hypothetical protein